MGDPPVVEVPQHQCAAGEPGEVVAVVVVAAPAVEGLGCYRCLQQPPPRPLRRPFLHS